MEIFFIVFAVVVVLIAVVSIIGAVKTHAQNKNAINDITQKILTNISENPKSEETKNGNFCEYCGSFVPKEADKCPNCGANVKLKNN